MHYFIRRLSRTRGFWRVNLPKVLIEEAGLADCEVLVLSPGGPGVIKIEEYRGSKEDGKGLSRNRFKLD